MNQLLISSYLDVGKTKRGELSIFPKSFVVLSHCLHMMPRQKSGLGADNVNLKVSMLCLVIDLMLFPVMISFNSAEN